MAASTANNNTQSSLATNVNASSTFDKFSITQATNGGSPFVKIDSLDHKNTIVVANFGPDGKTITGVGYVYQYNPTTQEYESTPFNAGDSTSQEALQNATFIFDQKGEPVGQTLKNIGNNDSIIANGKLLNNVPNITSTLSINNSDKRFDTFLSDSKTPNGASLAFKNISNNDIKIGDQIIEKGSSYVIKKNSDGYYLYADKNNDGKIDDGAQGQKLSDVNRLIEYSDNNNITTKVENTNIDLTTTKSSSGDITGVNVNTDTLQLEYNNGKPETLVVQNGSDGSWTKYTAQEDGTYKTEILNNTDGLKAAETSTFGFDKTGQPIGDTLKNIEATSQNSNGMVDSVKVDGKEQSAPMDYTSIIVTTVLVVVTVFIILIFYYNAKRNEENAKKTQQGFNSNDQDKSKNPFAANSSVNNNIGTTQATSQLNSSSQNNPSNQPINGGGSFSQSFAQGSANNTNIQPSSTNDGNSIFSGANSILNSGLNNENTTPEALNKTDSDQPKNAGQNSNNFDFSKLLNGLGGGAAEKPNAQKEMHNQIPENSLHNMNNKHKGGAKE